MTWFWSWCWYLLPLLFAGFAEVSHALVINRQPYPSARKLYHGPSWNDLDSMSGQCGRAFRISRESGHSFGVASERTARIIGGFPVEAPIPWQVSIEARVKKEGERGRWEHVCGGSLISEHHILTASHCFDSWHRYRVKLGKHKLYSSSPYEQTYEIRESNIVIHRRYQDVAEFSNDIAILRIEQDNGAGAKLNEHVHPICVPNRVDWELPMMEPHSGECIVSGFGSINGSMPDVLSNTLRATSVPIHSQDRCNRLFNSERIYQDDAAPSGGDYQFLQNNRLRTMRFTPLACKHNGRYYLVGVVSWGRGCGEPNRPGLYTRVSHFLRWIHNEKLLLGPI